MAPYWTACVLAGEIPTLSSSRPREPLKPSEPSIMEERKQEIRAAMALQLPPTSSTLVWERYAIEKSSYEDRLELYKIKFKEVNETYPHENRKVFQMVEKAMSDASVDDLKRTTVGAAAHASRDAFTFLRLAMEAHDFVPAQISDRACQNAQMRFESYRQPPSSSISEQIDEFKRRLEYYCKLRGEKIEEVYRDYQLKGLLLSSLHPEAWGEWCRIRQLTSTMPITFEAVEVALLEEESARVLSRLKDPTATYSRLRRMAPLRRRHCPPPLARTVGTPSALPDLATTGVVPARRDSPPIRRSDAIL